MKIRIRNITMTLACALAIAACGGSDSSDEAEKETVFDPMVKTIDKAAEVENQVLEHKDKIDQALKEAEEQDTEDDGTD